MARTAFVSKPIAHSAPVFGSAAPARVVNIHNTTLMVEVIVSRFQPRTASVSAVRSACVSRNPFTIKAATRPIFTQKRVE